MPQINVNEIDQSVVTRVVSDDKVKVLVPGICSFGPVWDESEQSVRSFTDVTEFDKVYGYTEAQYNPIENEYSRIYARELIKKGAEVSFIRLNSGSIATYDLGDTESRQTPAVGTSTGVINAAKHSKLYPGDNINGTNYTPYMFAPQIESIEAKYSGSFGSTFLISIIPITSSNVSFSYQYANISVYFVNQNVIVNSEGEIVSRQINKITKLETKRVTTNPADKDYFEDVEFDYITITGTPTARTELSVIWSNLNTSTEASPISGFPEIPLKYKEGNVVHYNVDSLMNGGTDFEYSQQVLTLLQEGFKGFVVGTNYSIADVNEYIHEVYGDKRVKGGSLTVESVPDTETIGSTIITVDEDPISGRSLKYVLGTQLPTNITVGSAFVGGTDFTNGSVLAADANTIVTIVEVETVGNIVKRYGYVSIAKKGTNIDIGIIEEIYSNLNSCFENFTDPYIYDFDFVTSGGLLNETFTITGSTAADAESIAQVSSNINAQYITSSIISVHQSMKNLVETRKDCVALFDVYSQYDPISVPEYVRILDTSYGTVHNPWCWINHPSEIKTILMPPSFIFLYTMLSNLINNVDSQKWFPPAGVKRATARVVVKPQYEIGSVLLNAWQNDSTSRVNPIMKLKQYGYVIYGQYTAYEAQDEFTHSALESLNVRLVSNVVKKKIFSTCMELTFEPNNKKLWLKFFAEMDKYLSYMKSNDGVYAYRIVMDESTVTTDDINELRVPGKVYIAPTRTAEFFDIDFVITDAGVTFGYQEGE